MSRQPRPRRDHVAVGVGQKLYIWGGEGDSLRIQPTSVESFNVLFDTWERPQQLHGSLPGGLWDLAYTNEGQIAYTFGGFDGSQLINTLYQIDLSTQNCKELVPVNPSRAPMKLCGSRMVYFNHQLVVYGGSRGQGLAKIDELHVFDLRTSELEGDF